MEWIQSKSNARVKEWRKLHTAKGRKQFGKYLIEGTHLIQEAMDAHQPIEWLLLTERYNESELKRDVSHYPRMMISEEVANAISFTPQPQGIFAIVHLPDEKALKLDGQRYLLLDNVQDPGNIGTMIRTADAAGFDGVVLGKGCADVYNDKVLRATQGSLWHLQVVNQPLEEAVHTLQAQNIPVYATALDARATAYQSVAHTSQVALIVGNEGQGVSPTLIEQATRTLYIPMYGKAESLNVAIAASILMFYFHP